MAIRASENDARLLARLMRAEAEGDGEKGMMLVGAVGVNRIRSDCLDFRDIRTVAEMVYQRPGGFESTLKNYFYQSARSRDVRLAYRVLRGEVVYPARTSLWFFRPSSECPASWYGQAFSGQYRNHCFYEPTPTDCPDLF